MKSPPGAVCLITARTAGKMGSVKCLVGPRSAHRRAAEGLHARNVSAGNPPVRRYNPARTAFSRGLGLGVRCLRLAHDVVQRAAAACSSGLDRHRGDRRTDDLPISGRISQKSSGSISLFEAPVKSSRSLALARADCRAVVRTPKAVGVLGI